MRIGFAALERSREALERDNATLKKRLHLLECFVDVRHREKAGFTSDRIREIWHGTKPPQNTVLCKEEVVNAFNSESEVWPDTPPVKPTCWPFTGP
jgi:hypothetical protein